MKEVIAEVLQVEEKVNADIRQAHSKASEIRNAADKEVSDKITKAKEQGREIVQSAIDNAKKEAQAMRNEKIRHAESQRAALVSDNSDKINGLVDDICKIILTTEYSDGKQIMATAISKYAFINAKLRARISQILPDEIFTQLVKASTIDAALAVLRDTPFAKLEEIYSNTGDIKLAELDLLKHEIEIVQRCSQVTSRKFQTAYRLVTFGV